MSRRSTPERIDQARQAATRSRLVGEGATETTAEGWVDALQDEADRQGLQRLSPDY